MKTLVDTSLEVYQDIKPHLGAWQERVLGVFYERQFRQDLTNREIADYLGVQVAYVSPRVFELRQKGLLELSRKRMCSITQRRVNAWRLATAIRAR